MRAQPTSSPKPYTINLDGSGEKEVPLTGDSVKGVDFAWSPDGTKIAFTHVRRVETNIGFGVEYLTTWVMNADGSNQRQISEKNDVKDTKPDWSPDSKQLIFRRKSSGIYKVNADGSSLKQLTNNKTDADAAWSPDGSKIVFNRNSQIFTMNPDGSSQQQINNPALPGDPSRQGEIGPNWQPLPMP